MSGLARSAKTRSMEKRRGGTQTGFRKTLDERPSDGNGREHWQPMETKTYRNHKPLAAPREVRPR